MLLGNSRICICGGGHIAHSLVAACGRFCDVSVFTRRPYKWNDRLEYQIGDGPKEITAGHVFASNNPQIVADSDVIVIALPRFAIDDELAKIMPFLRKGQSVVFIPAPAGMEQIVSKLSMLGVETVAFQRVPFVARVVRYGHSVWMGSVRSISRLALSDGSRKEMWKTFVEHFIGGEVQFLSSFLIFTFSNSNPLLHPSRLVELLRNGNQGVYEKCPYFYAEWTDVSSEHYVKADAEMYAAFMAYSKVTVENDYESALDHYESKTPQELTCKMRSIESLKQILAPWKQRHDGLWEPDFTSRYFTEDVPFGTSVIQKYAHKARVCTPTIDMLISEITKAARL